MSSARHPLPTDLVALVSFDGRVYPNEAKPLERLGLEDHARPLGDALEQWFSFATGKHTWVSVRGATIRGLISARKRTKRSAWEVEALIHADDDDGVALSLLSQMLAGVIKQKAERVFLRLDSESHLVAVAREAGFFAYAEETLYRRELPPDNTGGVELPLRPRAKGDLFGIFQLYSHTVPANVRAIEGATFREWQAAQESWGAATTDLLLEEEGIVTAWLRFASGSIGRFAVLAAGSGVSPDDLVSMGLRRLSQCEQSLILVRDHDSTLALTLERQRFVPMGNYTLLAKRLSKPSEELAPEAASEAVPVS